MDEESHKHIMEYLSVKQLPGDASGQYSQLLEYVYKKDEVQRMDVYIHVKGVTKADAFMRFE